MVLDGLRYAAHEHFPTSFVLPGQDRTIGAEHQIKGADDNSRRDLNRQCGFMTDDSQRNLVLDAADFQFCTVV